VVGLLASVLVAIAGAARPTFASTDEVVSQTAQNATERIEVRRFVRPLREMVTIDPRPLPRGPDVGINGIAYWLLAGWPFRCAEATGEWRAHRLELDGFLRLGDLDSSDFDLGEPFPASGLIFGVRWRALAANSAIWGAALFAAWRVRGWMRRICLRSPMRGVSVVAAVAIVGAAGLTTSTVFWGARWSEFTERRWLEREVYEGSQHEGPLSNWIGFAIDRIGDRSPRRGLIANWPGTTFTDRLGWPFYAATAQVRNPLVQDPPTAWATFAESIWIGGLRPGESTEEGVDLYGAELRIWPQSVIWSGFLGDLGFWWIVSAGFLMVAVDPALPRRLWRRSNRRCSTCGYPLSEGRCSECGVGY
jgi:hypothetical protein